MGKFQFSRSSRVKLNTVVKPLQQILELAIRRSQIDFGIAYGRRTDQEQFDLYQIGRSLPGNIVTNINGIDRKSKHQVEEKNQLAEAVDIFAFVNGRASWEERHLCTLGGLIMSCSVELGYLIRWGGNWDQDGEIITDQRFTDLPHFEFVGLIG